MGINTCHILSHDCSGVEAIRAETSHSFGKHSHETFGIGLIHAGAQKSASGRGMVEAGAGNVITVNPREIHDGHPLGDAPRRWDMLYFDPVLIADIARDLSEGKTGQYDFTRPVLADRQLANIFRQLFHTVTAGQINTAALRREELLILLLRHAKASDEQNETAPGTGHTHPARQAVAHARIARSKSLIDDMPASAHSLGDLATEAGLSRFQTLRDFTLATGLTPHAYIIQRRLDLVRRLIKAGIPLAEAADSAGFADQSHMHRHFMRAYGMPPGHFARAIQATKTTTAPSDTSVSPAS
jgi:AraC-like DNA-binding protein